MGIWQAPGRFSPQIVKSHSCITSGTRRCHGSRLPTVRSQHSGHAGGFQQFVARQAANGTCAKATRLNQGCWTWQSSVSLKLKPGLESLYPVFKDASIKRFVPQLGNKTAQTLCALCTASFWLEVKDPSQSRNKKSWWEPELQKAI